MRADLVPCVPRTLPEFSGGNSLRKSLSVPNLSSMESAGGMEVYVSSLSFPSTFRVLSKIRRPRKLGYLCRAERTAMPMYTEDGLWPLPDERSRDFPRRVRIIREYYTKIRFLPSFPKVHACCAVSWCPRTP